MRPKSTTVEQIAARIASAAQGVVTRQELIDAAVSEGEIKHRLAIGALIRMHPGVYRVGHTAPSLEATYMAAVKAAGKHARLSERAAAHVYGLTRGGAPRAEVTAPAKRLVKGVKVKRSRLDTRDCTTRRQIPITTVP